MFIANNYLNIQRRYDDLETDLTTFAWSYEITFNICPKEAY